MTLLFIFRIRLTRIHQEYITVFQDKLNFSETTGRERMYKNFMTKKFNIKNRYEKSVILAICSDCIQEIDIKRDMDASWYGENIVTDLFLNCVHSFFFY